MGFASVLRTGFCATAAAALLSGASVAAATSFYASPTGTTSTAAGTGTITNPWALATALAQPTTVHPGDTIWLRGGTYRGKYVSYLTGTSSAPIVVRSYPGEWAKLDSGVGTPGMTEILSIAGSYSWFWGFEIMSSDPVRQSSQDGSWPTDINRGACVGTTNGVGAKLINLVCHDAAEGFELWQGSSNLEAYGNIIYNNGWNAATGGGHGHGIYVQNIAGSKLLTDNIIFQNFSHGIHAYTEGGYIDNIQAEGNTLFVNGDIASAGSGRNLLIGGLRVAQNPALRNNLLYFWAGGPQSSLNLGFSAGCANPVVVDNYIADNSYFVNCSGGLRTGNTFAGKIVGFTPSQYPSNTYFVPPARPTGARVFVRPNRYEAGRGHVTVFNWDRQSSVAVDLSGVLSPGTSFEVRNAQNFFGPPVISGTYAGGSILLPMTGLSPAAPVGGTAPPATGPEFNAFVLLSSSGATPTPTPTLVVTPTWTPTPTRTPTVTPTAPPVSSMPTRFNTLTPCRTIDTRNPNGATGGPAMAANGARVFPVTGRCGIPSNAKAVSANVTVVNPARAGLLRIYPGNTGIPLTSVINFVAGKARSNNAMVVLATDGTGTIGVKNESAGTVHLALDISGYFR